MPFLLGMLSGQSKYLWLSAMGPITIEIELAAADAGVDGTESSNWSISNAQILGDVVDISPDLLNAYTKHLEEGKSLPYHFGTFANVEHSVVANTPFSVNQSRSFSRLNTVFVSFMIASTNTVKDSTNFQGIGTTNDDMEWYIALGPNRYPVYPSQKAVTHYYYYLDALGKLNSDAHTPGTTLAKWKADSMVLGWNFEKAHSGAGAAWSGVSTRNGLSLIHISEPTRPY